MPQESSSSTPPLPPQIDRVLKCDERYGIVCVHCGGSRNLGDRFWVRCAFDQTWKVRCCQECAGKGEVSS
ncbi:hypothetical protein FHU37_002602 [Allostreptomyces psammosilenae]|uniref:Uncharacterized protein n=1 Tax=Allostreptomyces psammosilenae TaxID=1892865 RepID=A0A852ZTJ9_9ACTN|nr:hypothetical protein [Allostreptomyces psammosilenae]